MLRVPFFTWGGSYHGNTSSPPLLLESSVAVVVPADLPLSLAHHERGREAEREGFVKLEGSVERADGRTDGRGSERRAWSGDSVFSLSRNP